MSAAGKKIIQVSSSFKSIWLWAIFFLYIILAGYAIAHHEMWGDEIHSWNIAKGSSSFFDLIHNSRYEGHPPAWYIILWIISMFTHNLIWVQFVHLAIASLSIFLILFFSPFSPVTKLLLPFGYFFLFEYAVISRNYAISVLLIICVCLIIGKNFRHRFLLYYSFLFLLCNTHLLSLLIAAGLHIYFLLSNAEILKKKSLIILHILAGILVAIPAVYFIFPPADSELNTGFWMGRWGLHKLSAFAQAPLRAFLPIPAWWNYHFWNTQFLIEAKSSYGVLRYINLLIAAILLILPFYLFFKVKKSFLFYLITFILCFILSIAAITLTTQRHAGFLFIIFLITYWLYHNELRPSVKVNGIVNSLLVIQLLGSFVAIIKDSRHSFSNSYQVTELLSEVPLGKKIVTDYWALNAAVSYTDKPFYCIDMQKPLSFVLWNRELGNALKTKSRYYRGIRNYFQREGIDEAYLLSSESFKKLSEIDSVFIQYYRVTVIDSTDGAIEKFSDLYLYHVKENDQEK